MRLSTSGDPERTFPDRAGLVGPGTRRLKDGPLGCLGRVDICLNSTVSSPRLSATCDLRRGKSTCVLRSVVSGPDFSVKSFHDRLFVLTAEDAVPEMLAPRHERRARPPSCPAGAFQRLALRGNRSVREPGRRTLHPACHAGGERTSEEGRGSRQLPAS
jgi:hypothetical protein